VFRDPVPLATGSHLHRKAVWFHQNGLLFLCERSSLISLAEKYRGKPHKPVVCFPCEFHKQDVEDSVCSCSPIHAVRSSVLFFVPLPHFVLFLGDALGKHLFVLGPA
jgi:hypothetical protein